MPSSCPCENIPSDSKCITPTVIPSLPRSLNLEPQGFRDRYDQAFDREPVERMNYRMSRTFPRNRELNRNHVSRRGNI